MKLRRTSPADRRLLCAGTTAAALAWATWALATGQSYVREYSDAKFKDLNPAMTAGAQVAPLWGDPAAGPSAVLFKMKRGTTPLHTHSSDYHLVVLEGVMKHWVEGEMEGNAPQLERGSYWFIRGGQVHADSCLTDECVAFIKWEGKRDARLAK
jgi:quercetin dioxygenase-like cupin family protein